MEVAIRRAEVGDAAQIQAVYANNGTFSGTLQLPYPSVEMWRARLQASDPNRYILVALVDEVIVGVGALELEANPRRRHAASIAVGVADPWAGKGIGTALVGATVRLADQWLNVLRLELTVYADNEAALKLYRKFGFEIEGRLRGHALRQGVYVDALAMARWHPNPP